MATRTLGNLIFSDVSSSTSPSTAVTTSTANATTTEIVFSGKAPRLTLSATGHSLSDIEAAVYAHIKALRALGRTTINTEEIATALSIPVASVNGVIAKLKEKGVKVIG